MIYCLSLADWYQNKHLTRRLMTYPRPTIGPRKETLEQRPRLNIERTQTYELHLCYERGSMIAVILLREVSSGEFRLVDEFVSRRSRVLLAMTP